MKRSPALKSPRYNSALARKSACADGDVTRATEEVADLIYHALVALRAAGGSLNDVRQVLDRRRA